nr:protein ILRUN-like [Cherax quadricarinatus]
MEVDEDLEGGLLRQFNCMLTTDKEVLIKELQTLVGAHLNEHSARFYLEMTDWNLQAAVCAYFDLQSFNKLPQMTFVKDITIGEGESVPPSTRFIKTWRIQNTGEDGWPSGCSLIFTGGEQLGAPSHISVSSLGAGEVADISVEMMSPAQTGLYSSKWRMSTAQGNFFGDTIWVKVQVFQGHITFKATDAYLKICLMSTWRFAMSLMDDIVMQIQMSPAKEDMALWLAFLSMSNLEIPSPSQDGPPQVPHPSNHSATGISHYLSDHSISKALLHHVSQNISFNVLESGACIVMGRTAGQAHNLTLLTSRDDILVTI